MSGGFLGATLGLAGTYAAFVLFPPQVARLGEFLKTERRPKFRPLAAGSFRGTVILDDVWFRYDPGSPWVVHGLNLKVEVGEKRWLRAPSGAGKTTILRLIAGLF